MEQPKSFVDSDHPNFVCKLHKALYGLKQAPRALFHRLTQALLELGFTNSLVDMSSFMLQNNHTRLFVLIYMDDIIITSTSLSNINDLITNLQVEFKLKDLGSLSYFFGHSCS